MERKKKKLENLIMNAKISYYYALFLIIKKSLKISHEETGILINLKNLRCYSTTYIEHN